MRILATSGNVDEDNFNDLRKAYNACMAESDIQKVGIAPIQALLGDLSKVITTADSAKGSIRLPEALLFLEKAGISHLLNLGVGADDKDPVSESPRTRPI